MSRTTLKHDGRNIDVDEQKKNYDYRTESIFVMIGLRRVMNILRTDNVRNLYREREISITEKVCKEIF